jgi:hypothetical protein
MTQKLLCSPLPPQSGHSSIAAPGSSVIYPECDGMHKKQITRDTVEKCPDWGGGGNQVVSPVPGERHHLPRIEAFRSNN